MGDTVQPVQVVQDVSTLVPPILAPSAFAGVSTTAVAGERSSVNFTLDPRAGGALVDLWWAFVGTNNLGLRLSAAGVVMTTPLVAVVHDMSPVVATASTVIGGTTVTALGDLESGLLAANNTQNGPITLFVPPGQILTAQLRNSNAVARFQFVWQEFQGPRAE